MNGSLHRIKAGDYDFPLMDPPEKILERMVAGRVSAVRVTFPEGETVRDLAKLLHREALADEDDVLRLARDRSFIASLGIDDESLEGYLFPETYRFGKRQGAHSMLTAMVRQFQKRLPEDWKDRAEALHLNGLHEVATLASMVEKEAVADAERPVIAAVFLNRLGIRMPLQSDPTAVYDLPGRNGPVTPAQLKRPSPYNTYYVKGLPRGPICNPGSRSIQAVLNPEKVRYLYFVSKADGTHHFSETLDDHNRAVADLAERRKAQAAQGSKAVQHSGNAPGE